MSKKNTTKGLELAEKYFAECGLPILRDHFPDLVRRVAATLPVRGSEGYGFDDAMSRDHSWGPKFLLLLSADDAEKSLNAVQSVLDEHLPKEFEGFSVRLVGGALAPRNAWVATPEEVCRYNTGHERAPSSDEQWLPIPENCLFELTVGKVFYEPTPLITPLKEQFAYFPDMVWRKRLSFAWLMMGHCTNVHRLARRDDAVGTHAFLCWGLECCMRIAHLLRRRYAPVLKWQNRSFRMLPDLPDGLCSDMERAVCLSDLSEVEGTFLTILKKMGAMANDSGLISPQPLEPEYTGHGLPFNFLGFSQAFWETLDGPMKSLPIEIGPSDLTGTRYSPVGGALVPGTFT